MHTSSNLRNNFLFSSITLSIFVLSENPIASEGRIHAATQQNTPKLPNVDNPGKIIQDIFFISKTIIPTTIKYLFQFYNYIVLFLYIATKIELGIPHFFAFTLIYQINLINQNSTIRNEIVTLTKTSHGN